MSSTKKELRQKFRAMREGFDEEFIKNASAKACENLLATKEFVNADAVLLYYPIKNEMSPIGVFEVAKKLGKSIGFPVCADAHSLIFRKVEDLNDLSLSKNGLFEPNESCEALNTDENTICIVPAIAFSKTGHRLGWGGGYYDRFLKNFKGASVGISYSATLVDALPCNEHDIPLNMIITESEVHYFA